MSGLCSNCTLYLATWREWAKLTKKLSTRMHPGPLTSHSQFKQLDFRTWLVGQIQCHWPSCLSWPIFYTKNRPAIRRVQNARIPATLFCWMMAMVTWWNRVWLRRRLEPGEVLYFPMVRLFTDFFCATCHQLAFFFLFGAITRPMPDFSIKFIRRYITTLF